MAFPSFAFLLFHCAHTIFPHSRNEPESDSQIIQSLWKWSEHSNSKKKSVYKWNHGKMRSVHQPTSTRSSNSSFAAWTQQTRNETRVCTNFRNGLLSVPRVNFIMYFPSLSLDVERYFVCMGACLHRKEKKTWTTTQMLPHLDKKRNQENYTLFDHWFLLSNFVVFGSFCKHRKCIYI